MAHMSYIVNVNDHGEFINSLRSDKRTIVDLTNSGKTYNHIIKTKSIIKSINEISKTKFRPYLKLNLIKLYCDISFL